MATFAHQISLSILETRRYIAQATESDSSISHNFRPLLCLVAIDGLDKSQNARRFLYPGC